ncbi:MAG TPA: hypothetical protein PKE13_18945, partial [Hyphomicrobium zavarzinii]|nr:hypothetical protein [Hyphomicrobium zavarzinii]
MKRLPDRPNIGHLKKQAKDLLALYREGDASAFARFRAALPIAANADNRTIASLDLRLHDAQSCVAREHGFASWAELKSFVAAREAQSSDPAATALTLMRLIYAGDIAGGMNRARPAVAARLLEASPEIAGKDPYLACAVGDVAALREELRRDAAWKDRPGGALGLPALVAVTHSSLLRLPAYRERLMAAARLLLDAGADPGQSVQSRWAASPEAPSEEYPLSALYGAAGQNRDPELTQLLLERGANPNDGESLYHALESPACTCLLLKAGARVTGTNALYRALDLDDAEPLRSTTKLSTGRQRMPSRCACCSRTEAILTSARPARPHRRGARPCYGPSGGEGPRSMCVPCWPRAQIRQPGRPRETAPTCWPSSSGFRMSPSWCARQAAA